MGLGDDRGLAAGLDHHPQVVPQVKSAFTGAQSRHRGCFEEAHGGTLFLDEIGELSLSLQPKLLRVLEGRELRRVGGTKTVKVDVRVVAATNRDLRRMVNDGTFRENLYYRLSELNVELPPLADRAEDIGLLATHEGNISRSADQAGLTRYHLRKLLKKHGLNPR